MQSKINRKQTRARRMLNLVDNVQYNDNDVTAGPSHESMPDDEDPEEPFSPLVSEYVPSSDSSSDSEDDSPTTKYLNEVQSVIQYNKNRITDCLDNNLLMSEHSAAETSSPSSRHVNHLDNNLYETNVNLLTPRQLLIQPSNVSTPESFRNILASVTSQSQDLNQQQLSTLSESTPSISTVIESNNSTSSMVLIASSDTIYINNEDSENDENARGRKRQINEKNWQRNINKKLKNSGKVYKSINSKKERRARVVGDPCICKRKCFEAFSYNERQSVFNNYWKLADHVRQWDFILRYVKPKPKRVEVLNAKKPKLHTLVYSLPKPCGKDVRIVCKTMFLRTLDINEKTVYSAIDKLESESVFDLRGQHSTRPNKYRPETVNSIITHINLFPRKESHYLRAQTQRNFLCETLNRAKMYRLYKEWISNQSDYQNVAPASERLYIHIFNTKFNLGFFSPKKDMCEISSVFENADEERKEQLKSDYDTHLKNKETVRQLKEIEKLNSDPEIKTVACFDLEKVLSIPQSPVGIFHYKRKYPVFNFTIYDILQKQGYCYMWHAQIGHRGANEIASCLWIFLQNESARGIQEISLYSDNCTGQNRNRFVFAMYLYASKKLNIKITHRFLQKGHTQCEGDIMHSVIEKNKKHQVIFVPDQMYGLVRNAKINGNKYKVKEMTREDFFNFKLLVNNTKNWSHDESNQKVYWSKIKEVSVSPENAEKIFLKYEYESNPVIVDTNTKNRNTTRNKRSSANNSASLSQLPTVTLTQAYNEPLKISKNLYKDLISLCDSNAIPLHYQIFYRNLVPNDGTRADESDDE